MYGCVEMQMYVCVCMCVCMCPIPLLLNTSPGPSVEALAGRILDFSVDLRLPADSSHGCTVGCCPAGSHLPVCCI